jgi:hypothetical protein
MRDVYTREVTRSGPTSANWRMCAVAGNFTRLVIRPGSGAADYRWGKVIVPDQVSAAPTLSTFSPFDPLPVARAYRPVPPGDDETSGIGAPVQSADRWSGLRRRGTSG